MGEEKKSGVGALRGIGALLLLVLDLFFWLTAHFTLQNNGQKIDTKVLLGDVRFWCYCKKWRFEYDFLKWVS